MRELAEKHGSPPVSEEQQERNAADEGIEPVRGLGESREPLPTDPRCIVKGHLSRVCELGTKCCVVQHSEWRDNGQGPVPLPTKKLP